MIKSSKSLIRSLMSLFKVDLSLAFFIFSTNGLWVEVSSSSDVVVVVVVVSVVVVVVVVVAVVVSGSIIFDKVRVVIFSSEF